MTIDQRIAATVHETKLRPTDTLTSYRERAVQEHQRRNPEANGQERFTVLAAAQEQYRRKRAPVLVDIADDGSGKITRGSEALAVADSIPELESAVWALFDTVINAIVKDNVKGSEQEA